MTEQEMEAIISAAFIKVTGQDPAGNRAAGMRLLEGEGVETALTVQRREMIAAKARIEARKRTTQSRGKVWWLDAYRLAAGGFSQARIAESCGVSQNAVSYALKQMRERGMAA